MSVKQKRTFEEWKALVDKAIEHMCGLSADDLPDWRYREAYDEGMTALAAAGRAINAAKGF